MRWANATRSRRIWRGLTGATSRIAPRGTPKGTADSTASAKASFSLMTVRSPAARASPPGIGVGPVSTRTAACAAANPVSAPSNTTRAVVPNVAPRARASSGPPGGAGEADTSRLRTQAPAGSRGEDYRSRLAQQVAQHQGVIAARIVRGVQQRHALLRGALPQRLQGGCLGAQLGAIAPGELEPARGVVVEPLAQRGAWSELGQPGIESRALPADAARPEPIDQRPKAVRGIRLVIDTLDLDVLCAPEPGCRPELVQRAGG